MRASCVLGGGDCFLLLLSNASRHELCVLDCAASCSRYLRARYFHIAWELYSTLYEYCWQSEARPDSKHDQCAGSRGERPIWFSDSLSVAALVRVRPLSKYGSILCLQEAGGGYTAVSLLSMPSVSHLKCMICIVYSLDSCLSRTQF